jgi:hypothetical protein
MHAERDRPTRHRLTDLRIITYAWTVTKQRGHVGATGRMTSIETTVTLAYPIPSWAWPVQNPQYQCLACGAEFADWSQTQAHISDTN